MAQKLEYICPYCGEKMTKDTILFFKDDGNLYPDSKRENFLKKCCASYPFERDKNRNAVFKGVYFYPGYDEHDENANENSNCLVTQRDENGFPLRIKFSGKEYPLKPEQLERVTKEQIENHTANDEPSAVNPVKETATASVTTTSVSGWGDSGDDGMGSDFDGGEFSSADTHAGSGSSSYVGGKSSFDRACPSCHSRLDKQFGRIPTYNIALFGGRAAGKTAYLLALTAQVKPQVSERGLGSVELLEESQWYYDILNSQLQRNEGITAATSLDETLFPFVFRFTTMDNRSCFMVFYDAAGEGMKRPEYIEDRVGVQHANIMMLMLDTNMLNNGAFYEQVTGKTHGRNDCNDEGIELFMNKCISDLSGYGLLNSIQHVIAVTTKIDLALVSNAKRFGKSELMQDIYDGNRLKHNKFYDLNVEKNLERCIEDFYKDERSNPPHAAYDIKKMIRNAFSSADMQPPTVSLMAVSTWTRPIGDGISFVNDPTPNARRHRVVEPFLKILAINGMIDAKAGEPPVVPGGNPGTDDELPIGFFERLFGRRKAR